MGLPHYIQGRKEYFLLDDLTFVRPKREIEVTKNTRRMTERNSQATDTYCGWEKMLTLLEDSQNTFVCSFDNSTMKVKTLGLVRSRIWRKGIKR
jgi:hypothetical protein